EIDLSIRFLDYDPMGHVNNSVYIQFLETLICRAAGNQARVKCLKIQYHKEIGDQVEMVKAGLKKIGPLYQFKIYDSQNLYAGGEVQLAG
ncbi:MAG: hypothetical protein GY864_15415, partial [Desulfobacterales bacterium]|nr:hypothetical protein [Desulfobacterales bacterium]